MTARRRLAGLGHVAGPLVRLSLLAVVARGGTVARDLGLSYAFGAGPFLDAFFVGIVVPMALVTILSGGIGAASVPAFLGFEQSEGEEGALAFFRSSISTQIVALTVLGFALFATAPSWVAVVGGGLSEAHQADAVLYFRTGALSLPLLGMAGLVGGILTTRGRFAVAVLAPAVTPLVIALAAVGGPGSDRASLQLGLAVGPMLELAVVILAARRSGLRAWPTLRMPRRHVRLLLQQAAPATAAAATMSTTTLVDQAVASRLGPGSVSYIVYGGKLTALLLAIPASALATWTLPTFSRLVAEGRRDELVALQRRVVVLALAASVVPLLVAFPLSETLARLVFGRGAGADSNLALIASVQRCYLFQIPFYAVSVVFSRMLTALGRNPLIFLVSVANVVVNAVTDLAFAHWFGVAGIAASTSLVYVSSAGLQWHFVRRAVRSEQLVVADAPVLPVLPEVRE